MPSFAPRALGICLFKKNGIDFESLINSNNIILCKLSQGMIGTENSYVLGSLILSKIHQAILRRQQSTDRKPVFIYLDEFQNFITPSIKEMLSGVRKYAVGLTLSHQDLQQLQRDDSELLNSVLNNTNTRIAFRVGESDAKKLDDGFEGFDAIDLQNLSRGQAIVRIEQPQYDCSLDTFPLPIISQEGKKQIINSITAYSRTHYATSKEKIEKLLFEILNIDLPKTEKKEAPVTKEKPVDPPTDKSADITKEESLELVPSSSTIKKGESQYRAKEEKDISTHRYTQHLVKKMAEAKGYTAVLEVQLPNGTGQVDVLLTKESKTIAVEISVTTDAEWEMHNIQKCINAGYDVVASISGDPKQLDKIKKKCIETIPGFESKPVRFLTLDAFFEYLSISTETAKPQEQIIKGYRVNVSYDQLTDEEVDRKRKSVAKVVLDSLKRRKGNS